MGKLYSARAEFKNVVMYRSHFRIGRRHNYPIFHSTFTVMMNMGVTTNMS